MKTLFNCLLALVIFTSCQVNPKSETVRNEIYETEKAFEKMVAEKGVAEAFYFFADVNAVIKRGNDSLIIGKENIKAFYLKKEDKNTTVNWTPDFIEVSKCGTMAYTYGKYVWKVTQSNGDSLEYKGVFHTVWKKQPDNSWKYVWD